MKRRNNNLLENVNNTLNNVNCKVKNIVDDDIKINIVRVILIIYTSLVVPILDNKQLELVNNNIIRLIVVALIVYLSFMDMVTAILLTISFLVTLHQQKFI